MRCNSLHCTVQIYLDRVQDLLAHYPMVDPARAATVDPWRAADLRVRESSSGVYIEGLTSHIAGTPAGPRQRTCVPCELYSIPDGRL